MNDGVAVVRDLGVGDGAAGFRVAGVVVRVVGWEDGGGGSYDGADLLGRHGCGRFVVECVVDCSWVLECLRRVARYLCWRWSMCTAGNRHRRESRNKETYRSYSGHLNLGSTSLSVFETSQAL